MPFSVVFIAISQCGCCPWASYLARRFCEELSQLCNVVVAAESAASGCKHVVFAWLTISKEIADEICAVCGSGICHHRAQHMLSRQRAFTSMQLNRGMTALPLLPHPRPHHPKPCHAIPLHPMP